MRVHTRQASHRSGACYWYKQNSPSWIPSHGQRATVPVAYGSGGTRSHTHCWLTPAGRPNRITLRHRLEPQLGRDDAFRSNCACSQPQRCLVRGLASSDALAAPLVFPWFA